MHHVFRYALGSSVTIIRNGPTVSLFQAAALAATLLAGAAQAQGRGDGATGAAAPAVRGWFAKDLSLVCSDPNGVTVRCGPANTPTIHIYYGNAGDGPGTPDALAFIRYLTDPTGSAEQVVVAVFRQSGGGYEFVKRLPTALVGNVVPGAAVRFQHGQASWSAEALRSGDSRSMPTGHKQVTVSIR